MKRSAPPKRKTPLKRGQPPRRKKPISRNRKPISKSGKRLVRQALRPQKVKRFAKLRSPEYMAWIRTLPCATTGTVNPGMHSGAIEAAHIRTRAAAGGDVGNVIPLCSAHHQLQHWQGIRTFAANHWVGGYKGALEELRRIAAEVYPKQYEAHKALGWPE